MAVPTLTPSSNTSAITLPSGTAASRVEDGEMPYGMYSDTYSGLF